MKPLKFHPLADAFPLIEGEEFAALVADVKARGVTHKIVLLDGMILDGRNRYRAARAAKVKAPTETYKGGDPVGFVIGENLRRRHMDASQRALAAARIESFGHGGKRWDRALQAAAIGRLKAADLLNVSPRLVADAAAVRDHGSKRLNDAVAAGKVAVSTAAEVAVQLPPGDQDALVARGEKEILAKAKAIRADKNAERKAAKVARIIEINKGNAPLEFGGVKFVVASADPPWRYEQPLIGDCDRSIENKYPTMSLNDICAMPVHEHMADASAIYLHIPQPLQLCLSPLGLTYAHQVGRAWGDPHWNDAKRGQPKRWFIPRAMAVWEKRSPADIAKSGGPLGMGHYWRTDHECLVVMTRGGLPLPDYKPRSVYHIRSRGELEHSEKPAEIYADLVKMYPAYAKAGLLLALFERQTRPGFVVWGNQAPRAQGRAA
ncbi:MAG: hypothetical protein ACK4UO_06095 [Pseudolabrys sp.]